MRMKIEVLNIGDLYPSRRAHAIINPPGAVIGAAEDADWVIQDNDGNINDKHFKIEFVDGKYALSVFARSKVFINGAKSSVPGKKRVLINDGDEITFGSLKAQVKTKLNMSDLDNAGHADTIMKMHEDDDDGLVIDGHLVHAEDRHVPLSQSQDPMDEFEDLPDENTGDPLELIDDQRNENKQEDKRMAKSKIVEPAAPDYNNTNVASLSPKKIIHDDYGFETDEKEDNSHNYYYTDKKFDGEVDQETLRLLAQNLGVPFHDLLPEDAPVLLAEIGISLHEAVKGLNHLFVSRSGSTHRFPLATMHIHAIEDNPLKFSENASEALDSMYVNRGKVHLSAPAAIEEGLRHVDQHQQSTEVAIEKGLNAIMRALHPKALERRFSKYSRGNMPEEGIERDAWKWKMFEAYVSEMTSHRQTGLKMLFWEVFGSAYQDHMRKLDFDQENDFSEASE